MIYEYFLFLNRSFLCPESSYTKLIMAIVLLCLLAFCIKTKGLDIMLNTGMAQVLIRQGAYNNNDVQALASSHPCVLKDHLFIGNPI